MPSKVLELTVGLFFILGVAAVFTLTFRVASLSGGGGGDSYRVTADFENTGQLRPGAAVTLAGVRVGRVTDIAIDRTTFEARVTMAIDKSYDNIPKDTGASIMTAGLLGEQYVGLNPGGDEASLAEGDKITLTQSALVLENLIGQFLATKADGGAAATTE